MKNFCILSDALDCVESRLGEDLSPQQVAEECHCSLSSLQKLFRYVFHISVADYISRRRMTCCARELITTGKSILDIAMDYGYHSPEVFTRAFARVWGTTPAAFRKNRRFSGLFPKFEISEYNLGGSDMKEIHRKYEITELYDYLNKRRGTYILAFDIKNLIPINDISVKAGDLAILEALRRIEEAAGEDMLLIRVGGDEFALATGLKDEKAVDALAQKVTAQNGCPIEWEGKQIPLSLYAAKAVIPDRSIRYSELFPEIYQALLDKKQSAQGE